MDISTAILQKSTDFLKASLRDEDLSMFFNYFEEVTPKSLIELLDLDKKVFWLNVYNGLVQNDLRSQDSRKVDRTIFTKKMLKIAGVEFTLDEIEHGILRGNYWKYGLGYIPGKYLAKDTKHWKCKHLDPRIHFQLNCGAASCPIIRPLTMENIESELEAGERDFILEETVVDDENKKFILSGLFLFYFKDFNGSKGIKTLVKSYFPNRQDYKVSFSSFDWTLETKKVK